MTETSTRHADPVVYLTDQIYLARHVAVELVVSDGTAWIRTQCGDMIADHSTVNLTRDLAGWFAGCPICGAPTTRPDHVTGELVTLAPSWQCDPYL